MEYVEKLYKYLKPKSHILGPRTATQLPEVISLASS
jgi:hypothetical protein